MSTIFHKIVRNELPATFVYETDDVLAFNDIHPQAATHVLFIPKEHLFIASVREAVDVNAHVPGLLISAARDFAEKHGIIGYKLQFNVGKEGGQEVPYIHLHFISPQSI